MGSMKKQGPKRPGRVRVIGGALRGRRLRVPGGLAVRPTSDRVREALFDLLGDRIVGATVLDVYAGSGAVGIEALSRGAAGAVLVESHREALDVIEENLALDPLLAGARVIASDVAPAVKRLAREGTLFSIVFMDPPYGPELERGLRLVSRAGLLAPDGIVIAEHEAHSIPRPTAGLVARLSRSYGRAALTIYDPSGDQPEAGFSVPR